MSQTVEVRSHQRSKPHSAIRAQTTAKLLQEVDRMEAALRKMERDLGRLVLFNVRRAARGE